MTEEKFVQTIWDYYLTNRRSFPWRDKIKPYTVFVSEIMLQQTQAPRVVAKYQLFIRRFPNFISVKHASTSDIIAATRIGL